MTHNDEINAVLIVDGVPVFLVELPADLWGNDYHRFNIFQWTFQQKLKYTKDWGRWFGDRDDSPHSKIVKFWFLDPAQAMWFKMK